MNKNRYAPLIVSLALVLAAGCGSAAEEGDGAVQPAPAAAQPAAAQQAALMGTGRVLETMNSGGYTYVNVDLGGNAVWAAGPQVQVKVGDTVSLPRGMEMQNYHSNTLDRTFPSVWFVPAIHVGGAPTDMATAHRSVAPKAAVEVGAVERLPGGQTVEEIVTGAAALAGKDVAVRGRVVKYNGGILGANWIHLQDGTGGPGTNDLTVTTAATVKIGDVVVVRGKVSTDRDFGSGYVYAVIVENAAVTKE